MLKKPTITKQDKQKIKNQNKMINKTRNIKPEFEKKIHKSKNKKQEKRKTRGSHTRKNQESKKFKTPKKQY